MKSLTGKIYLLHFSSKYQHAQHYLGFTTNLKARLNDHQKGQGARLMEVVVNAGIEFELVRTWDGDRNFERQLKKRRNAPRLCPICQAQQRRCK